jgi:hypothetical protein
MLDPELLKDWLNLVPNTLSIPFVRGPRSPEFSHADLIGVVTMLEGLGESLEGIGDHPSFQLRLTARENQQADLYRSAHQIDDALRFGDYPADLWGTWIVAVTRSGGGPSELQADEHDRVSYVCTYNAFETV